MPSKLTSFVSHRFGLFAPFLRGSFGRRLAAAAHLASTHNDYARLAARSFFPRATRVYLYHIRKTGGTSINKMFLSLSGIDPDLSYQILQQSPSRRVAFGGYVVAGYQPAVLAKGDYHYGFSHEPFDRVCPPVDTFTLTCFRDPVARVLSHWRMLCAEKAKPVDQQHGGMRLEFPWLGDGFGDFVERLPERHLCNQLYMFATDYDLERAVANVRTVDFVAATEDLAAAVPRLNELLDINLSYLHTRQTHAGDRDQPTEAQLNRLRDRLQPEVNFLQRLREEGLFNSCKGPATT